MPPKPLFDLDLVDLSATVFARQHIRQRIAQRAEMEMIDRIVLFEPERGRIAGVKEVRKEEFWVAGHFPGRPLFPGVLMIEAAGQLCSFYFAQVGGADTVIAFAAADNVRFRGVVTPGDTLVILGHMVSLKKKVARFKAQGFVGKRFVFEGLIVGMTMEEVLPPSSPPPAAATKKGP